MSEETTKKFLDANTVTVKVKLFSPFYNFLKDYSAFFGDDKTIEDLCRVMIYSETERLYRELAEFADQKGSFIKEGSWFSRHSHIALVAFEEPDEETE